MTDNSRFDLVVWKAMQYVIHVLEEGGEQSAADLLHRLRLLGDAARDLAYRLHSICECRG